MLSMAKVSIFEHCPKFSQVTQIAAPELERRKHSTHISGNPSF